MSLPEGLYVHTHNARISADGILRLIARLPNVAFALIEDESGTLPQRAPLNNLDYLRYVNAKVRFGELGRNAMAQDLAR